ncbi:holo-ACP synthase [Acidobacteriota bacterium]
MYVTKRLLVKFDDVADVIKRTCETDSGNRYFTKKELSYCGKKSRSLGARLVIKEFLHDYFAAETGYKEKDYKEIEIANDHRGAPNLRLSGMAGACARELKIGKILVSISHSKRWVSALVLICFDRHLEYR